MDTCFCKVIHDVMMNRNVNAIDNYWHIYDIIGIFILFVVHLGCPADTGVGICVEQCGPNNPCPPGQVCCSNGCGHVCKTPEGKLSKKKYF